MTELEKEYTFAYMDFLRAKNELEECMVDYELAAMAYFKSLNEKIT